MVWFHSLCFLIYDAIGATLTRGRRSFTRRFYPRSTSSGVRR